MQHSSKLARAFSLAIWLAIVETVVSVAFEAHAAHPSVHLDATAAYAWSGLAALTNAVFQATMTRALGG